MIRTSATMAIALTLLLGACTPSDDEGAADTTAAPDPTPSSFHPRIEWTEHPVPDGFRVHTIVRAGNHLFGLAWDELEQPDPRTMLWISGSGASWEPVEVDARRFGMSAGYFRELALVGTRYVAVVKGEPLDGSPVDHRLVTSNDGRVWDQVDIGDSYAAAVAGDESGAIAITRSLADGTQSFWHSRDGTEWEPQPPSVDFRLYRPVFVNGVFYATTDAGEGHHALYASAQGAQWIEVDLPESVGTDTYLYPAEFIGSLAVLALGRTEPQLWVTSRFGHDWFDYTPPGFTIQPGPSSRPIISSERNITFIVDPSYGSGSQQRPAVVWLPHDDAIPIAMDGVVGAPGGIPTAAAIGDRIVLLYQKRMENGTTTRLWIGEMIRPDEPGS